MTTQTFKENSLKSRLVNALSHRSPQALSLKREEVLDGSCIEELGQGNHIPSDIEKPHHPYELRQKPGQPAQARTFLTKKPTARVIGATLLEELYKTNQVGDLLHLHSLLDDQLDEAQDSIPEEQRDTSQLRSSLRDAQKTHRVPRVNKHLTFYGTDGGECSHIFFYEAVKVKLPWTGPKYSATERPGQWLKQQGSPRASTAHPKFF